MKVDTAELRVVADEVVEPAEPAPSVRLGAAIRDAREAVGFSLEDMAAATKIPRGSLAALEQGATEELPGPVFVKGFVRCCARVLELDSEELLAILTPVEPDVAKGRSFRRESRDLRPQVPASTPSADATVSVRSAVPERPGATQAPANDGEHARAPGYGLVAWAQGVPGPQALLWLLLALLLLVVALAGINASGGAPTRLGPSA